MLCYRHDPGSSPDSAVLKEVLLLCYLPFQSLLLYLERAAHSGQVIVVTKERGGGKSTPDLFLGNKSEDELQKKVIIEGLTIACLVQHILYQGQREPRREHNGYYAKDFHAGGSKAPGSTPAAP